jgi:hypothetical protein
MIAGRRQRRPGLGADARERQVVLAVVVAVVLYVLIASLI